MNVISSLRNFSGTLPGPAPPTLPATPTNPGQGQYRMAWIVSLPAAPCDPQTRWQVRYRDGTTRRSAADLPHQGRGAQRPTRGRAWRSRRLPRPALTGAGIHAVWGIRHHDLVARLETAHPAPPTAPRASSPPGSSPASATSPSLLGTICNAAVDDGHLDHSPLTASGRRRRPAALTTPARPSQPRMIWLTRPQVDQLADAIDSRYRALIVLAAHTGARWSELTALCWIDVRTNYPLDDGAITGPGQLRIPPPAATTSPSAEDEPASPPSARPRSRPSRRTIALDPDTIAASARTANSSADVPATWSSPAPAAPAAPAANSHPPTSRASGSAPCPPPGWTRPGPTRSGHTSTTCATPTPSGCSPSRPPSARSPGGWATPTPWSPCACTSTPRPWSRRTSSPRAPSASPPIAGPADPPPMTGGSAALRRTQAAGRPEGWCWRPDWTTGPTGVHNAGDAVAQRYDTTFSAPGPAFPGPCALRESAPPW